MAIEGFKELSDNDLENVSGGAVTTPHKTTNEEIINYINTVWGRVPQDIRSAIFDALNTAGRKAACSLAEKLIKRAKLDWAKPMVDYLKNQI